MIQFIMSWFRLNVKADALPRCLGERKFPAKNFIFVLTSRRQSCIIIKPSQVRGKPGSIAQLVEHMPYKHGVTGSSPVVPTTLILFSPLRNYLAR